VTVPSDYDDDPGRWQLNRAVRERYASGDVYPEVAERIVAAAVAPVLDVGCGEGELTRHLPRPWPWIGLDSSPSQLKNAPSPVVRGDATALPVADASVGAVTLLWMLYHLPDPDRALAEARRVTRPGGIVAACTNSLHDSPELAAYHQREPSPFDAEDAAAVVARHFGEVQTVTWDAKLTHLPDRDAVRDYLLARFAPPEAAQRAATSVQVPLDVTKRGVLVFGRRL